MIKRGRSRGGCALQETHTHTHVRRERGVEKEKNPILFIYFKLTSWALSLSNPEQADSYLMSSVALDGDKDADNPRQAGKMKGGRRRREREQL